MQSCTAPTLNAYPGARKLHNPRVLVKGSLGYARRRNNPFETLHDTVIVVILVKGQ